MGNTSEPICEIAVDMNKIGMTLIGAMNPIAAARRLESRPITKR